MIGGPERPLSTLGEFAFRSYWKDTILELLRTRVDQMQSIEDIEEITGIKQAQVAMILRELHLIGPVHREYELQFDRERLAEEIEKMGTGKAKLDVDPLFCIWSRDAEEEDEVE
jgi:hypothetical protein